MRQPLLRVVAALSLCLGSIDAAAADQHPITVPGGDLAEVLAHLALDTDIDLLFASDLVHGQRSPGAREARDLNEALRQILRGTGLGYAQRGERAITIVALVASASPSRTADMGPSSVPEVTVRDRRLVTDPPISDLRTRTRWPRAACSPQRGWRAIQTVPSPMLWRGW